MRIEIAELPPDLDYMLTENTPVDLSCEPLYAVPDPALKFRPTSIRPHGRTSPDRSCRSNNRLRIKGKLTLCSVGIPTRTSMRIQDTSHFVHLRFVSCGRFLARLIQGRTAISGRLSCFLPPFGFLPILLGHDPFTIYAVGVLYFSENQRRRSITGHTPSRRGLATTSYHQQRVW